MQPVDGHFYTKDEENVWTPLSFSWVCSDDVVMLLMLMLILLWLLFLLLSLFCFVLIWPWRWPDQSLLLLTLTRVKLLPLLSMAVFKCPSTSPLYNDGCSPLTRSGSSVGKPWSKTDHFCCCCCCSVVIYIYPPLPLHELCFFISRLKIWTNEAELGISLLLSDLVSTSIKQNEVMFEWEPALITRWVLFALCHSQNKVYTSRLGSGSTNLVASIKHVSLLVQILNVF